MTQTAHLGPLVAQELARLDIRHTAIQCEPDLAGTTQFCAHCGYAPEQSANALLIASIKGEQKVALCVVLAHSRLDTNKTAREIAYDL